MKREGILFFIFIIILTFVIWFTNLIGPVNPWDQRGILVTINPGTTGREIADILYNDKLIRSKTIFKVILNLRGMENSLKAGIYNIKTNYSMFEIMDLLAKGKVATFRVTIPEGFTVEEIVRRLTILTSFSEEEFLEYASSNPGRGYLEDNGETRYLLEGFLYPDTYIIPEEYKADEILEVLLSVFEERWLDRLEAAEVEFTPFEIMTIASLIEKEARLDEEKPIVAAVIYNRLKQNMLLQIDASIQYILSERKERVLYSDLKIDSPYNTYLYPGLPPGPISSPGGMSIEAALNPADVDYLFYFAKEDGSHIFSRSYSEHLRLQNEMRK